MNVKIKDLIIADRFRKDFGKIDTLAQSIEKFGVIEPIVVEKEGERYRLIAGERRVRASLLAGRDEVPIVLRENLTELERKELELEENLHRKELDWTEEVELKQQIDELKRAVLGNAMQGPGKGKGWGVRDLAETLGESPGSVSQDLQLAKFLRKHPEKRDEFKGLPKTAAFRKLKMYEERLRLLSGLDKSPPSNIYKLIDAYEGLKGLESNSVDLILTDPPYGVKTLEKETSKSVLQHATDNLTPELVLELLGKVIPEMYRVLKPGRHIYLFFTFELGPQIKDILTKSGFFLHTSPLVWAKGRNMTVWAGLNYMRSYELLFFGIKKTQVDTLRALETASLDVLTYAPLTSKERSHSFEKPRPLLKFLIQQSTLPTELVLDPFAGVGSTLRAARSLGRRALGFDIDPYCHSTGVKLLESDSKEE